MRLILIVICMRQIFTTARSHMTSSDIIKKYKAKIIPATNDGIDYASRLLKEGKLVAFPTETVYGLGANALNADSVNAIFVAKGRPLTDPLIVHVATPQQGRNLLELNSDEEAIFNCLGSKYWPGPLTMIAKSTSQIPLSVTANTGYVGIRCPSHPLALQLLQICQLPIAAPSANRFAHVSPTRAHHVLADLGEKDIYVLNGDDDNEYTVSHSDSIHNNENNNISSSSSSHMNKNAVKYSQETCKHGIESTVLKINYSMKQLQIFRHGAVTKKDIEKTLIDNHMTDWSVDIVSRIITPSTETTIATTINDNIHKNTTSTTNTTTTTTNNNNNNNNNGIRPSSSTTIYSINSDIAPLRSDMTSVYNEVKVGDEAPGQAVTHYSPDVPCTIISDYICTVKSNSTISLTSSISASSACTSATHIQSNTTHDTNDTNDTIISSTSLSNTVLIDYHQQLKTLYPYVLAYKDLSPSGNIQEAARHLFDYLRWAETMYQAENIYIANILSSTEVKSSSSMAITSNTTNSNTNNPISISHNITKGETDININNSININIEPDELIYGVADRIHRAASGRRKKLHIIIE